MTPHDPQTPPTWTDPASTEPVATTTAPTPATAPVQPIPTAPPRPVVTVAPKRRSGIWMDVVLGLAALVAVGGVAFAVGRVTAPASTPQFAGLDGNGTVVLPDGSFDPDTFPGGGAGPNVLGGLGSPSIDGTVTAIDADSMTIALANGEEMTVALDDATTYHAATDAAASDVAVGDAVSVGIDGFGRGPGTGAGSDPDTAPTARDVTVSR